MDFADDDEVAYAPSKPLWRCEECGHENHIKPMPPDRAAFYAKAHERGSPKCPKCKSEAFTPSGF